MSSIITIKITTEGDYEIKQPIVFYPTMIGERGTTIYFPPTIKLTNSLFKNTMPDEEIISILTSPILFSTFINKVVRDDYYKFKKLSLKEAYDKGIVYNNMKYCKELFFNKRKIYFNGVAFTIRKSSIINNYAPVKLPGLNRNLNYEMTVNLSVIKSTRATRMNLMRENCKDKAKRIDDLSMELFGKKLGIYEDKVLKELLPAMYTSPETGFTTEALPKRKDTRVSGLPYQWPYRSERERVMMNRLRNRTRGRKLSGGTKKNTTKKMRKKCSY
jgi:hypothetical protein